MKKRTHLLVSKSFSKDFNLSKLNRFWLYFGSIAPDLTIMCLLKPHQFKSRSYDILERISSLDFSNKDWLFYYKVGVISHFMADFFTAPHNREGVKGFCMKHRGYEVDLDKFFRDNINSFKGSSIKEFNLKNYLFNLHSDYIYEDPCISTDFTYICLIVSYVLAYTCCRHFSYRGAA